MAIRFQYSILYLVGVFGLLENVPGKSACLKMRFTSKEFNRVWGNAHVMDQLKRMIQESSELNHQHGEVDDFEYALTDLMVTDFTEPHGNIVSVPSKGLRVKADGASVSMTGFFDFSNKRIPYIGGVGNLAIFMSGLDFSMNLKSGMDPLGRLTFAANDYSCTTSEVNLTFQGGWIILFSSFLEDEVRRTLRNNICKGVMKTINRIVEKKLSFPVTYQLSPDFELDYGLIQAPIFQSSHMETSHKCEISCHGIKVVFPFEPPTMEDSGDPQKMTYLWISDHMFNSLLYAAHVHNYLTTNISAADVQIMFHRIGIPDRHFSDDIKEFSIVSNSNPTITITTDDVKADFSLKSVLEGRHGNKNLAYRMSVIVNVKTSFTMSITDALYWKRNYFK
ncbi:hypothetical protein CHS0354_018145 [Potamilus streckersoni]|uniref:Lipid-binding serum glycoprotein N-terminal domain-containing protein n=1 Tax=Potamilus streckersoni TaxID=2493646 RepID=A0AAE0SU00_9BIVA|nr:hypothetical protein CHS0354_018145 [Potamilus streckersoni]